MYTVVVFRHPRRGSQMSLRMVVNHHVVAGIWTQNFWKSSQCSYPLSHLTSPLFLFQDRVSLCSPSCPGTRSVDQVGLELRNPPASASWMLGLKTCIIMPSQIWLFFMCMPVLLTCMCSMCMQCPGRPEEGVRSHYGWLWATMWLLGFELRTFRRAVSALTHWAISPASLNNIFISAPTTKLN